MTVPEAAAYLEVKPATVYALCAAGRLAHHRVGLGRGTIRIRQADVDAYLASVRVEMIVNADPAPVERRVGRNKIVVPDYFAEKAARLKV